LPVARNGLVGTIPTEMSLLSSLKVLSLWRNALSGTLPNLALKELQTLDVEENVLTGFAVSNMTTTGLPKLEEYRVSFNLMTLLLQPPPVDVLRIPLPTTLRQLWMSGNGLTGSLEALVAVTPSAVEELLLDNNALTGTLPHFLTNLDALQRLELQHNRLEGSIPSIGPGQWSMLEEIRLENNLLQGSVPASICGLRREETEEEVIFSFMLETLTADCGSEVFCDCCTECF
jgi:Leucine-rich repeat (LRR) protein